MGPRIFALGVVSAVLALAVFAVAPLRGAANQDDGWGPGAMGHMGAGSGMHHRDMPPELAFLAQIPPEERFSHFRGGSMTLTDQNGNEVVVNVVPGTVSSVFSDRIVITPNGETTTREFAITSDTVIHAMPDRGTLQAVTSGDQVVVMTVGEDDDAAAIMKHREAARGTPPAAGTPGAATTPTAAPATATPSR